jgi:hypothetical protein
LGGELKYILFHLEMCCLFFKLSSYLNLHLNWYFKDCGCQHYYAITQRFCIWSCHFLAEVIVKFIVD